ncbi:unnamed protein product, partial [Alopecurus aequalis]
MSFISLSRLRYHPCTAFPARTTPSLPHATSALANVPSFGAIHQRGPGHDVRSRNFVEHLPRVAPLAARAIERDQRVPDWKAPQEPVLRRDRVSLSALAEAATEPRARLEGGRERVPVGPSGVSARGEDRKGAECGGGITGEGEVGDESVERVRAAWARAEAEERVDGVRWRACGGEVPGEMREDRGVVSEAGGEDEGLGRGYHALRERGRGREDGAEGGRHW